MVPPELLPLVQRLHQLLVRQARVLQAHHLLFLGQGLLIVIIIIIIIIVIIIIIIIMTIIIIIIIVI